MRFVVAVATVGLLAIFPAGAAPAIGPEAGTIVWVELELPASNGLHARLETSDDETVTLELRRKDRQSVTYEVKGQVTEEGLKARFGRLGLIDVAFMSTKTLSMTEPSEECTGAPRTLREGIFSGTIDFAGERGYVRIVGSHVAGSMSVISQWQCPEDDRIPFTGISRLSAQGSQGRKRSASLYASSRRCRCAFFAGVGFEKRKRGSTFSGASIERREGMRIVRRTSTDGGVSAFVFDHLAGTATLRPPRPLSGRAIFKRRPHRRNLWRSTIRVPLLGAEPLRTGRAGFRAALYSRR